MTADTTIDLRVFLGDPLTQTMVDLELMAATWPADVREEVLVTLGSLAIICGTRGATEHLAVAEFLAKSRQLIRLAGEHASAVVHSAPTSGAI